MHVGLCIYDMYAYVYECVYTPFLDSKKNFATSNFLTKVSKNNSVSLIEFQLFSVYRELA